METQEEQESKTAPEEEQPLETPEAPPEEQLESPAETPEETPAVSEQEPKEQVVLSQEEFERLKKDASLKEKAMADLKAVVAKKRGEELFAVEQPEREAPPEEEPVLVGPQLSDYFSKREDLKEEFREQLAGLSEAAFAIVKDQLEAREQAFLRDARKGLYVSRQKLKDMFVDAIEFGQYKTRPKEEKETIPPYSDTGTIKTIRKVQTKLQISDRARQIQPFTKDSTGNVLPLDKIQAMLDKGQLQ